MKKHIYHTSERLASVSEDGNNEEYSEDEQDDDEELRELKVRQAWTYP